MKTSLFRILAAALLAALSAAPARAVTITLEYNGFNPGTVVTVFKTSDGIGVPVATQAAAVAGDTATNFTFELTAAGTYSIDLWGNVSSSSTRTTHRIDFVFDGTDIDSIPFGANKVTGFTANTTTLTLYTVPVYIDPDGFNPPADSPDGYIVQGEAGTSGRIPLDGVSTFANGGRAVVLVNGIRYMIHYKDDRDSLGQQFVLNNGLVSAEPGLLDEGVTTDASGDEAGSTHQLVRLNKTAITVNFNGLSHALPLADQADANAPLPIQVLPAGFNGSAEVLIHTDFGHMGYSFDFTMRLPNILFDVDAGGNIIDLNDDRATASGSTITFNTVSVKIDTPNPADTYRIYVKSTPVNSNVSSLSDLFTGDQDLKMVPIDNDATGVYYLRGSVTDARETFRIVYGGPGSFSLTTWTDSAGTVPLSGQQTITLLNGATVTLVPPPATGTVMVVR